MFGFYQKCKKYIHVFGIFQVWHSEDVSM